MAKNKNQVEDVVVATPDVAEVAEAKTVEVNGALFTEAEAEVIINEVAEEFGVKDEIKMEAVVMQETETPKAEEVETKAETETPEEIKVETPVETKVAEVKVKEVPVQAPIQPSGYVHSKTMRAGFVF